VVWTADISYWLAGVRCAVHLDGTVKGLLPKLAANGFDAVEALTPQPAGDLPVEDMRAVAGNPAVILWGGVPGVMFAPPYTWRDMQSHIRRVLRAWQDTPFILGVADQVPPDGDIDFCHRIAEEISTRSSRNLPTLGRSCPRRRGTAPASAVH
jgi:hypothetical protein